MHERNAMQLLETKEKKHKNQRIKNNGHKGKNNEAQGPCQKDSVSLSLLHPKIFRCTMSIGVYFHIKIGRAHV